MDDEKESKEKCREANIEEALLNPHEEWYRTEGQSSHIESITQVPEDQLKPLEVPNLLMPFICALIESLH
jgi:hypothetical protein